MNISDGFFSKLNLVLVLTNYGTGKSKINWILKTILVLC